MLNFFMTGEANKRSQKHRWEEWTSQQSLREQKVRSQLQELARLYTSIVFA
jgi:hypothetical protein